MFLKFFVIIRFSCCAECGVCGKRSFCNIPRSKSPIGPTCCRFIAGFTSGQPPLDYLSETISWHIPGDRQIVPWAGLWQGRAEVAQCLKQIATVGQPRNWWLIAGTTAKTKPSRVGILPGNTRMAMPIRAHL